MPAEEDDADESLESFVVRRFGREAFDRLIQPLIGGIYTADPAKLSMQATLPQFVEMERKYGTDPGFAKQMAEPEVRGRGAGSPPWSPSSNGIVQRRRYGQLAPRGDTACSG